MSQSPRGIVYLVGAGPGDPGLITVRGLSLVRCADVIVHDRLVGKALLQEARPDAEIVHAGKSRSAHRIGQDDINALLIDRARAGRTVVRLKGGDPFVFGRGFEELSACREAGVDCAVVPGVSSALAAPVAAGIPITSRRMVRSFVVVTGTAASESQAPELNYAALAAIDTIMILMGRERLGEMARSLIYAGRDPDTPAACIENATTPKQRVIAGTLETIADVADRENITAPVVTVIGAVAGEADVRELIDVALQDEAQIQITLVHDDALLSLRGRRIVITRPLSRSSHTLRELKGAGAVAITCPVTRFVNAESTESFDRAIDSISQYDWIAFTSPVAVRFFRRRLSACGKDARSLSGVKIASVGTTTARTLRRRGVEPDIIADGSGAAALVDAIREACGGESARVLFPRSDIARSTLPQRLRDAGFAVDEVIAYRTLSANPGDSVLREIEMGVDAVLFFSPSAAKRFAELGIDTGGKIVGCIGPSTAEAAREVGMNVDVVAREHTSYGLLTALAEHFSPVGAFT